MFVHFQRFALTQKEKDDLEKYPELHKDWVNTYNHWKKAREDYIAQLSELSLYLKKLSKNVNNFSVSTSYVGVPLGIVGLGCSIAVNAAPFTAGMSIAIAGVVAAVAAGTGAIVGGSGLAANIYHIYIKSKESEKLEELSNKDKKVTDTLKETSRIYEEKFKEYIVARKTVLENGLKSVKVVGSGVYNLQDIIRKSMRLSNVIKASDVVADATVSISKSGKVAANFSKLGRLAKSAAIAGVVFSAIGIIADVGVIYSYQYHKESPCTLAEEIDRKIIQLKKELEELTTNCDCFLENMS